MRINEDLPTESDFHRRRYVYNQRQFQFFKHALNLEKNFIATKRKDNKNVLSALLEFNKEKLEEMEM